MQRTASARGSGQGSFNRKHISFNHFVEQCIAVDSDEECPLRRRFSLTSESSDEDDDDDEDDVLTFRSSPRTASFAVSALSEREPHTIVKLAPTTLKSSEVLPAPSPAVFYGFATPGTTPTPTYYASSAPQAYNYGNHSSSRWSEEDETDRYAMGFDYFGSGGADLGIGEEYAGARTEQAQTAPTSAGKTGGIVGGGSTQGSGEMPRGILKNRVPSVPTPEVSLPPSSNPPSRADDPAPSTSSADDSGRRGRSISRGSSSASASSLDRSARRSSSSSLSPANAEVGNSTKASFGGRGRSVDVRTVEAYHPSSSLSPVARSSRPSPSPVSDNTSAEQQKSPEPATAGNEQQQGGGESSSSPENERPALIGRVSATGALPQPSVSLCTETPTRPAPSSTTRTEHGSDRFLLDTSSAALASSSSSSSSSSSRLNEVHRKNSSSGLRRASDPTAASNGVAASAAHRALLKNTARRSTSTESWRSTHDDYGFTYGDEEGGIVSKAAELVGTARDIVGAIWNVGTGALWGRSSSSS
jgi:hypothetical protein